MPFHLMWPDPAAVSAAGFRSVAHVPFILGEDWSYHRAASCYLRDRALLHFRAQGGVGGAGSSGRYPTRASLRTFGDALVNFLEWCESRGLNWVDADYTHDLVHGYQEDMLRGAWSSRGTALSPQTVNARLGETVNFLKWAADRRLRAPFNVLTVTRKIPAPTHRNAHGHEPVNIASRVGRVRPSPATLRLPDDQELAAWLKAVAVQKGATKALMVDLIIMTGVRREECCQWRVETLPLDRDEWRVVGDKVTVEIKYGAKGTKYIDERGDEYGPARHVAMPLALAERIHHYREFVRPGNRAIHVSAAPSLAQRRQRRSRMPRSLFLSDFNGEPVSAHGLYEAWTGVGHVPFPGWSPHGGRHLWACKTLLAAVERQRHALEQTTDAARALNWIWGCATDALMLEVKPQLGHVDARTTEMYLRWVTQVYQQVDLHEAYARELESIPDATYPIA